MAKNIVTVLVLMAILAATAIYLTSDRGSLRKKLGSSVENTPRISLEDFTLYRYYERTIKSTLSAKIGFFIEPNMIEVYGNIRGIKFEGPNREYLLAESATAYFDSSGLSEMVANADILRAELENQVRVGARRHVLNTEYAVYDAKKGTLSSDLPVKLRGPKGQFDSQRGFTYDLESETMTINGPGKGVLQDNVE